MAAFGGCTCSPSEATDEVSPDADTEDLVPDDGADGRRDVEGNRAIRLDAEDCETAECDGGFFRCGRASVISRRAEKGYSRHQGYP